jgi:hypothetical protein
VAAIISIPPVQVALLFQKNGSLVSPVLPTGRVEASVKHDDPEWSDRSIPAPWPDARPWLLPKPAGKQSPVQRHLDHCPCPFCRPGQVDVGPLLYIASGHVPGEDRDIGSNARSQARHQFRRQVLGTVYQLQCWCPCCTRLAGRRVRRGC